MNKQITNIVFTKNRPLQLDGYLESLYRHYQRESIQTYILYKPELFANEYEQLFGKYSDCIVISEEDFTTDFFSILKRINTKYVLFGVDDVVYFGSVELDVINETFDSFADDIFGFSLRLNGQDIKKSDLIIEASAADQTVYSIDWTKGGTPTTRYPFELCATIYKSELVKKITKDSRKNNTFCENFFAPNSRAVGILSKFMSRHKLLKMFGYFYNPNTLESWNCRWCQNNSDKLPNRLFYQKICATAIQVNMVNTSTNNESDNSVEYTVETLAEKYRQGYRLDINSVISSKPTRAHCGKEFFILTPPKT